MGLFGMGGNAKEVPTRVYTQLIVKYQLTHEYSGALRAYQKAGLVNNRKGRLCRIFEPAALKQREKEKGVQLPDYDSLDKAQDLILFDCFEQTVEPYDVAIEDRRTLSAASK